MCVYIYIYIYMYVYIYIYIYIYLFIIYFVFIFDLIYVFNYFQEVCTRRCGLKACTGSHELCESIQWCCWPQVSSQMFPARLHQLYQSHVAYRQFMEVYFWTGGWFVVGSWVLLFAGSAGLQKGSEEAGRGSVLERMRKVKP